MFVDPQFWVAIAFIIFVVIIFNPIRKILISNLDSKIHQIKESINEAENLKNEAQITLSEIKKRQSEVKKEIELIEQDADKKIKQIEQEAEKKLISQIKKKRILALTKIEQLLRDANNEIKNEISDTALKAAIILIEKKLTYNEKQNLINNSIKEVSFVLKN